MHFLMLVSDKSDMWFRMELLVRSVRKEAHGRPCHFSVVVNDNEPGPFASPLRLVKREIPNRFLARHVEAFRCPYHWSVPAPSRWFLEPKADRCVFIDVDMIACKDLGPLYDLDPETVHGTTAYSTALPMRDWERIGFGKENMKFYFNFGMVVVPSRHVRSVGDRMMENVPKFMEMFPSHRYYGGQIALAYTLEELGLPRNVLPSAFNWYDLLPFPSDPSEILFLHYFSRQGSVCDHVSMSALGDNEYESLLRNKVSRFHMLL